MHWTVILFLISLCINGIVAYILRNSHYGIGKEPFKMPLIVWIAFGILTIIPVINSLVSLVVVVFVFNLYYGGELETNDDFWLTKEY
jgi:hypothetical protein